METLMKLFSLVVIITILSACASMHSNGPDSLGFSIPPGSTLALNKHISYASNMTHAVIQFGKEITDAERNFYEINCRLDFKTFGQRTIQPEDFIVTRTEDGQNWISRPSILRYYTEVYLRSNKDTDIIKMVCQIYGDSLDRNFTVAEMQATLGDMITFKYPPPPLKEALYP